MFSTLELQNLIIIWENVLKSQKRQDNADTIIKLSVPI